MRRRTRIDLGQKPPAKEEAKLERKRQRWAARNIDKLDENPFLEAIKPNPKCDGQDLESRLKNLEFGNYPGYFNYRNNPNNNKPAVKKCDNLTENQEKEEEKKDQQTRPEFTLELGLSDNRLEHLKEEWFAGKDVLDIGCNRGYITYAIARRFSPRCIVGVDIDARMINMANKDLHLHLEKGLIESGKELRQKRAEALRKEEHESYSEDLNHFPISCYISQGPLTTANKLSELSSKGDSEGNNLGELEEKKLHLVGQRFPNNIVFVEHNYVLASDELVDKQGAHFDTIVCLSVTKWIHLNYGDHGLERFFKRIYKHLRANGLLILEAQPFDNYGRRKKLSASLRANYYSIQLKPDQFDAYLLSEKVGFRQLLEQSVIEHQFDGFRRPLKVFLK